MSTEQKPLSVLLDEIEARANAMTLGPWEVSSSIMVVADKGRDLQVICNTITFDEVTPIGYEQALTNAVGIAAARSDIPALVKALRRACDLVVDNVPADQIYEFQTDIAKLLSEQAGTAADSAGRASNSSPASSNPKNVSTGGQTK